MKYVFNMVLVSKIKVPQSIASVLLTFSLGHSIGFLNLRTFFSFLCVYRDLEYMVGDLNSAEALLNNKD